MNKLSAEELQKLNEWLHGFRQETVQATEKKAAKEGRRKFDVIVSRVVGPFYGLKGATIIRLEDGSVWKQATRSDHIVGSGQENLGVAVYNAGMSATRCGSRARAISTSTKSSRRSSGAR